jgi:MFS family permease
MHMFSKYLEEFKINYAVVINGFFSHSPPYFAVYLSVFDLICVGMIVVVQNTYGYQVVPSYLAGTIASMILLIQFIVGKSSGALIGGILLATTPMEMKEMFLFQAALSIIVPTLLYLLYTFRIKKIELKIIEDLANEAIVTTKT